MNGFLTRSPFRIRIGCNLSENNNSGKDLLLPLFPPPPPPESIESVKNYYLNLPEAGVYTIAIPRRAAPVLHGFVWKDENGNGKKDEGDKGYSSAKLYLDENGNFQHDENETSFEPEQDGTFYKHVSPGQYSVYIEQKNPDANVTFLLKSKKHTWHGPTMILFLKI